MAAADSETTEIPMVNVQIDGEWIQVPKGTRMIEACKIAGKEVPHYCYHPKLTSPGNCRMCLVEMGMPARPRPGEAPAAPDAEGHVPIGWMPRPAIACANTVAENMGIRTDSTLTRACREGVMELLLINHPLDCPICDQAGECELQEYSVEHGKGGSRFRDEKVHKPKNVDIGPRIRLDDERCIMCSRCIRFSEEIADDPVLGFTDRGSHTTLAVAPGRELANNYSLNTVDICPVGALTSNDFRFQMRVWFLKETKSIDTNCGTGCNIVIHSRENKVYRITPRENNDVNSAWMPDSHRLNFHYLDGPGRLTEPLIRERGAHRIAEWREAFDLIASELSAFEPGEIAVIASGRMTNEELFMAKRFIAALGADSSNVDIVPHEGENDGYLVAADRNPNTNGAKLILGLNKPGSALDGIKLGINSGRVRAIFVFGEDLTQAGFEKSDLEKLEFLVATQVSANATADLATIILPAAAGPEKRGSMFNVTGRLQRLNQAVDTPGLARDDWEILRDLTSVAGGSNGIHLIEEVFKAMAAEIEVFADLSLSKIGDLGLPVLETGVEIPLLKREAERKAQGLIVG